MIYTSLTKAAMRIAYEVHKEQVDIGKLPYINHPLHVAEQMHDEYSTCVALLHDVVEDSNGKVTIENLESLGFPKEVTDAVNSMTKRNGEDYFEYIERLSKNKLAKKVKIEDLKHNLDTSRLPKGMKFNKLGTYKRALEYLYDVN